VLQCQGMFIKWIRDGLLQPGKTQAGLARALGVDASAVSKLLRGVRKLDADEIAPAAAYLGIPPPVVGQNRIAPVQTIPVRFVACRGIWREAGMPFRDLVSIPIAVDQRWVNMEQWAAQINATQHYVICVTYKDVRALPRPHDLVLVERSRGDLMEYALYYTVLISGVWHLQAEDDATVALPMSPSVTVLGLCIGRYQSIGF